MGSHEESRNCYLRLQGAACRLPHASRITKPALYLLFSSCLSRSSNSLSLIGMQPATSSATEVWPIFSAQAVAPPASMISRGLMVLILMVGIGLPVSGCCCPTAFRGRGSSDTGLAGVELTDWLTSGLACWLTCRSLSRFFCNLFFMVRRKPLRFDFTGWVVCKPFCHWATPPFTIHSLGRLPVPVQRFGFGSLFQ